MLERINEIEKEMNEITQNGWNLVFEYQATGDPRIIREFLEGVDKVNKLMDEHNQLYKIYERSSRV